MLKSTLLSIMLLAPHCIVDADLDIIRSHALIPKNVVDKLDVCPGLYEGTPIADYALTPEIDEYEKALGDLNVSSVIKDIQQLLRNSQECWPADDFGYGASYGPLFVRLAWHCSGTYRSTDGMGGCAGARQRFSPEASWADNVQLDKARALLAPIKQKYGVGLSWGDLIIMSGEVAILDMGGPLNEICVGRIDEKDGTNSTLLGPTKLQEKIAPCPTPGNCPRPLGASKVELIYVNPEGFMGVPDPEESARQIREIFGRMGMNDTETVALIGGGHAFGKSHGACNARGGAGLPPDESPLNPWNGNCGTGKGLDTFSSGIEGQWTTNPLTWDNEFFKLLCDYGSEYKLITGPGGKYQWEFNFRGQKLMMMTTDLALIYDEKYDDIVYEFATDISALNRAFADAWSKLTQRGGQWAQNKKCIDDFDGLIEK